MKNRFRIKKSDPYAVPHPPHRKLQVFSLDPSLMSSMETVHLNTTTVEIPWEFITASTEKEHDDQSINSDPDTTERKDGPAPGPIGDYIEVIDYDPSNECFYRPVDLNDPYLLARDGLDPSVGNPQFHQQMVYAVAMRTIYNFEGALGRRALWSPRLIYCEDGKKVIDSQFVRRLRLYPHALREANAFYHPGKKALLFGYFSTRTMTSSMSHPGLTVFTCLSHDIIAHETTHALLDGMHRRFVEPTNPDVLALHEAFADIVALFQHFTLPHVLEHAIARTRGDLSVKNPLSGLARQFGQATGRSGALRDAIEEDPETEKLSETMEPHKRGAILLAAVFDAFLKIYKHRTSDLYRIASNGTGILPDGEIHPDLVKRLSKEAAKTAQHILNICIRALDYLPPVDVTFGDYLRAMITADFDLVPDDSLHYRTATIEAFRSRGIFPNEARSMGEESLLWEGPEAALDLESPRIFLGKDFRDKLLSWDLSGDRYTTYKNLEKARATAHQIIKNSSSYKQKLVQGVTIRNGDTFEIHSLRPARRSGQGNKVLMDFIMEITQKRPGYFGKDLEESEAIYRRENKSPDFWYRSGDTLIGDLDSMQLRYCISKRNDDRIRYQQIHDYVRNHAAAVSLKGTYFDNLTDEEKGEAFSFIHRIHLSGDGE